MSSTITYGDIYRMFKLTTGIKESMIDDYRPAKYPYITRKNGESIEVPGIVLFLSDGGRMIYYPDVSKIQCNIHSEDQPSLLCK